MAQFQGGGITYTLSLKHPAFSEEKEWRLIALVHKPAVVQYRAVANGLKPYVVVDLADEGKLLRLARVYVGPTQDQTLGCVAATGFLTNLGYNGADIVRPSAVPYRD